MNLLGRRKTNHAVLETCAPIVNQIWIKIVTNFGEKGSELFPKYVYLNGILSMNLLYSVYSPFLKSNVLNHESYQLRFQLPHDDYHLVLFLLFHEGVHTIVP